MAARLRGNALQLSKGSRLKWQPEQPLCPYMEDHPAWPSYDLAISTGIGTMLRGPDPTDLGGGDTLESAAAANDGDAVGWHVWLTAGTYTCTIIYTKSTNRGIIQPSLGGVSLGVAYDGYAASTTPNTVSSYTGITVAANGVHAFRLTVNGKNASSAGYVNNPQWWGFLRTGA